LHQIEDSFQTKLILHTFSDITKKLDNVAIDRFFARLYLDIVPTEQLRPHKTSDIKLIIILKASGSATQFSSDAQNKYRTVTSPTTDHKQIKQGRVTRVIDRSYN